MQKITNENVKTLATSVVELMKRAGAERNHIEPLYATITVGAPSAGIPWSLKLNKDRGVTLGTTRREAYAALQAMHFALSFTLGM